MSEKDFVGLLNEEMKELIENLPQVKQLKAEIERLTEKDNEKNERSPFLMCEDYDAYLESMSKTELLEYFHFVMGNYKHSLDKVTLENTELQKQVDGLKEKLHMIWALGIDYDGCNKVESLKGLIDELVKITQMDSKEFVGYYGGVEV